MTCKENLIYNLKRECQNYLNNLEKLPERNINAIDKIDFITYNDKGWAICKGSQIANLDILERSRRITDILLTKTARATKHTIHRAFIPMSTIDLINLLSKEMLKTTQRETTLKERMDLTRRLFYVSPKVRDNNTISIIGKGYQYNIICIDITGEITKIKLAMAHYKSEYARQSPTNWLCKITSGATGTVTSVRRDNKGLRFRSDKKHENKSLALVWNYHAPHYKGANFKQAEKAYLIDVNHSHLRGMAQTLNVGYKWNVPGITIESLTTITTSDYMIFNKKDADFLGITGTKETVKGAKVNGIVALCELMDDLKNGENWVKNQSPIIYNMLKAGYTRTYGVSGMSSNYHYTHNYQNFALIANHTYKQVVEIANTVGQDFITRPATDSFISLVNPLDKLSEKQKIITHTQPIFNYCQLSADCYIWEEMNGTIIYKGEKVGGTWSKEEHNNAIGKHINYKARNEQGEVIKVITTIWER